MVSASPTVTSFQRKVAQCIIHCQLAIKVINICVYSWPANKFSVLYLFYIFTSTSNHQIVTATPVPTTVDGAAPVVLTTST